MRRLLSCSLGVLMCASSLSLCGCGEQALAQKVEHREFSIAPGQACIVVPLAGGEVRGTFVGEHDWWFVVHQAKANQSVHIRKDLISQVWVTDSGTGERAKEPPK